MAASNQDHGQGEPSTREKILAEVSRFYDQMLESPHLNGELKLNNNNGKIRWAMVSTPWNLDEMT